MRLSDFKVLTFDCYGTLIDWEGGMIAGLSPLTRRVSPPLTRDAILEAHSRHEGALQKSLAQIPYIKGMNNHMGSKITSDTAFMNIILEEIQGKDIYFVDSRTTANTIAFEMARQMGIPSASRNVFLDGEVNEEYIKKQLHSLFRLASKNGQAIGICHPSNETIKVLRENFHLAEQYNLQPVFASQVVN